ncbi:MAG TPA: FAD-dependent oxidoreductase [Ktedonobacterales bacterium]
MPHAAPSTPLRPEHAIVIGGSMAGLLAARVLADSFARVTLIERDRFPDGPVFRAGVPQSRHAHILLLRGRLLLEQFFPGIVAELRASGAENVNWPRDMLWLSPGGWSARYDGIEMLTGSRELIEWTVRRRVAALPAMRFVERCDAVGLLPSADGKAVAGVRLRHRDSAAGDEDGEAPPLRKDEELAADLVVDASGRDSQAPRWLEALGYPAPEQVTINPLLGYGSRYYARPPDLDLGWQGALFSGTPAAPRAAVLLPIEGNRWHVTVAGMGGDYPPTDNAGFLEFLRELRSPLLYDVLRDAAPLSPVVGYRRTENQMRRYERLAHRPERFVVLGDAACAFNPIYGQGMTVAALSADLLGTCLRERASSGDGQRASTGRPYDGRRSSGDFGGVAGDFQRRLAGVIGLAWLLATGEDTRYPTTQGPRPGMSARLAHRYFDRVIAATTDTPHVGRTFLSVAHLLIPPSALFSPRIAYAALATGKHEGLPAPPLRLQPPDASALPAAVAADTRQSGDEAGE